MVKVKKGGGEMDKNILPKSALVRKSNKIFRLCKAEKEFEKERNEIR